MNICADCGRFMDCSWEKEFVPVPGWKAKKTKLKVQSGPKYRIRYIDSYDVQKCPLYKEPAKRIEVSIWENKAHSL